MEKTVLDRPRFHFLIGTPGVITVHTKEVISKGDTVKAYNKMILIQDVRVCQTSSYYIGCNFYELKYQIN